MYATHRFILINLRAKYDIRISKLIEVTGRTCRLKDQGQSDVIIVANMLSNGHALMFQKMV